MESSRHSYHNNGCNSDSSCVNEQILTPLSLSLSSNRLHQNERHHPTIQQQQNTEILPPPPYSAVSAMQETTERTEINLHHSYTTTTSNISNNNSNNSNVYSIHMEQQGTAIDQHPLQNIPLYYQTMLPKYHQNPLRMPTSHVNNIPTFRLQPYTQQQLDLGFYTATTGEPPPYSATWEIADSSEEERRRVSYENETMRSETDEIPDYTALIIFTICCFPFVVWYAVFLIRYQCQFKKCVARGDLILAREISERIRKICIYTVLIGTTIYLAAIAIFLVKTLSRST